MCSLLYKATIRDLGTREPDWKALLARIMSISGPDLDNQDGKDVACMIEQETQLSRAPERLDTSVFAKLLGDLCDGTWPDPNSPNDPTYQASFVRRYEDVTDQYFLSGPEIKASPPIVYRYISDGTRLFLSMVDMLQKAGSFSYASSLQDLVDRARTGRNGYGWSTVVGFVTKQDVWSTLAHDQLFLCPRRRMFVTFDLKPSSLAGSSLRLHAALGLWKRSSLSPCFLEIALHVDSKDRLKFPTFADAGWFRFFRSAPLGAQHGLTQPHANQDAIGQQPEAVMETLTFQRLRSGSSIRFVPP